MRKKSGDFDGDGKNGVFWRVFLEDSGDVD